MIIFQMHYHPTSHLSPMPPRNYFHTPKNPIFRSLNLIFSRTKHRMEKWISPRDSARRQLSDDVSCSIIWDGHRTRPRNRNRNLSSPGGGCLSTSKHDLSSFWRGIEWYHSRGPIRKFFQKLHFPAYSTLWHSRFSEMIDETEAWSGVGTSKHDLFSFSRGIQRYHSRGSIQKLFQKLHFPA